MTQNSTENVFFSEKRLPHLRSNVAEVLLGFPYIGRLLKLNQEYLICDYFRRRREREFLRNRKQIQPRERDNIEREFSVEYFDLGRLEVEAFEWFRRLAQIIVLPLRSTSPWRPI